MTIKTHRPFAGVSTSRANALNAMNETNDNEGGYLVPEIHERTEQAIRKGGVFRRLCFNVDMKSDISRVPTITAPPTVADVTEGGMIPISDATVGQVTLSAKKKGSGTICSTEVLEDGDLGIALATAVGGQHSYEEDVFAADVIETGMAAGQKITVTDAATATFDDWLNVIAKVEDVQNAAGGPGLVWVMSRAVLALSCQKLQTTVSSVPPGSGYDGLFLGIPVVTTPVLASATGATSGDALALLADWQQSVAFGARSIKEQWDTESRGATDEMIYFTTNRFDVKLLPVDPSPLAGLFVA